MQADHDATSFLRIRGAREHNLKNLSLDLPHHQLIGVIGPSGSGKSSLVHQVIAQEAQSAFLEFVPRAQHKFLPKLSPVAVDSVEGLRPVVALKQASVLGTKSSTSLGTSTGLYDHFRLLFARFAQSKTHESGRRSFFSPHHPEGACEHCRGIGKVEFIDEEKLIQDPKKSLRNGCLSPTLPNGYIMYSQLTLDSLNMVCEAHDFNIDIPWEELGEDQKEVIFNGSSRIKVPLGKHTEESRLKWTGLKAKAREADFYQGILKSMNGILERDRNPNILKYTSAKMCPSCQGDRLNQRALSFTILDRNIAHYNRLPLHELLQALNDIEEAIPKSASICSLMKQQIEQYLNFGFERLSMKSKLKEMSSGQAQVLHMLSQVDSGLTDLIYVFDEPSSGLHPSMREKLIHLFRKLVNVGNTVFIVEHDLQMIAQCDYLIELGPGAGSEGGELLFAGSLAEYLKDPTRVTAKLLMEEAKSTASKEKLPPLISLDPTKLLKKEDFLGRFSVLPASPSTQSQEDFRYLTQQFPDAIQITQQSMGKNARSNPATYVGLAELIRDEFAKVAKKTRLNLKKSNFSFNTKGGRCETCLGAGKIEVGMHFLGKIETVCDDCSGKRFKDDVLACSLNGKNISDIFEMSVNKAFEHFTRSIGQHHSILRCLSLLKNLGLGYLLLGQSSGSLSGGEAKRIKLAKHLLSKPTKAQLFLINEPGAGLHERDLHQLNTVLRALCEEGHGVMVHAFRKGFLEEADVLLNAEDSASFFTPLLQHKQNSLEAKKPNSIALRGVRTNHLQHLDINIPKNKITAIIGRSGSGKTSLAFGTIAAECEARYLKNWSPHIQGLLRKNNTADLDRVEGLSACVTLRQFEHGSNSKSTVETVSGIGLPLRLLFSRLHGLEHPNLQIEASEFSYHRSSSACPKCKGKGTIQVIQEKNLIANENADLSAAFIQNTALNYYTNAHGQFMAIWKKLCEEWNFENGPISTWTNEQVNAFWHGTGDRVYECIWEFKNKSRSGEQQIAAPWRGIVTELTQEFALKKDNKNADALRELFTSDTCPKCEGKRLNDRVLSYHHRGRSFYDWSDLSIASLHHFLQSNAQNKTEEKLYARCFNYLQPLLDALIELGLGEIRLKEGRDQLSAGNQRALQLAGASHSSLSGMIFILDEPSWGMKTKQIQALKVMMNTLKEKGNTLILVEHRHELIETADHLIELGPEGGEAGGQLMFEGQPKGHPSLANGDGMMQDEGWKTLLQGDESVLAAFKNVHLGASLPIKMEVRGGQLDFVYLEDETRRKAFLNGVMREGLASGHSSLASVEPKKHLKQVLYLEQNKARPHTDLLHFLGLSAPLQKRFKDLDSAKAMGLKTGHFSKTKALGRCAFCKGSGLEVIAMDFMDDLNNACEACQGTGFKPEVLEHQFEGHSIHELLQTTLSKLEGMWVPLFSSSKKQENAISQQFRQLQQAQLGHLSLNRKINTLSGGEWQRVQLIKGLFLEEAGPDALIVDDAFLGLNLSDQQAMMKLYMEVAKTGTYVLLGSNQALSASLLKE